MEAILDSSDSESLNFRQMRLSKLGRNLTKSEQIYIHYLIAQGKLPAETEESIASDRD